MKIENISIDKIKPNPKNPRKITDDQLEKLCKSIKAFPEMLNLRPIVVSAKNVILGGNMRYIAAKELGLKKVPVLRAANLTKSQIREFIIKDNMAFGDWDFELLKSDWEAEELSDWGFDISDIDVESDGLEDDYEMPQELQTDIKPGDLLEIGHHRLLCGNSAELADVTKLMKGAKADMVFTDPPYGVAIGAKNRMLNSFQPSGRNLKDIKDDAMKPDDLKQVLLPAFINLRSIMADDCTVFVTAPQGGDLGMMMMMMMMMEAGLEIRHVLIWKKSSPAFSMNRLDYDYEHEPIFYTWKKSHVFHGKGQHKSSVWQIPKPSKSPLHPTMKPIELIENAILNSSLAGEIVLDAFTGSGSTLIACEKTGRSFRGVEIDPYYIDVILERLKQFSPECEIKKVNNG